MSWLYCDPKSRTSTESWAATVGVSSVCGAAVIVTSRCPPVRIDPERFGSNPHPNPLLTLLQLAFGLDRRRDHHLGLLELADVASPADPHGRLDGAHQVHRA